MCTTLGYIVSRILLNLGHVFRSRIVCFAFATVADGAKAKHVHTAAYLQLQDVSPRDFGRGR